MLHCSRNLAASQLCERRISEAIDSVRLSRRRPSGMLLAVPAEATTGTFPQTRWDFRLEVLPPAKVADGVRLRTAGAGLPGSTSVRGSRQTRYRFHLATCHLMLPHEKEHSRHSL